MSTLVHSGQRDGQDFEDLRTRVTDLEQRLRQRSTEVEAVRTELAAFKVRYRAEVGLLHDELDELEAAIAELELGELTARLDAAGAGGTTTAAPPPPDTARFTSDAVRRLFRDVAKAIHPDLAGDEEARSRRHRLMIEANRAYSMGDEERLRWILQSWERSPEAVLGSDAEATRLRLVRRAAQIEEELAACDGDLAELRESPMFQLKTMVDDAAARGKDLIRDMVRRLKRDIMAARNRLDAMRA